MMAVKKAHSTDKSWARLAPVFPIKVAWIPTGAMGNASVVGGGGDTSCVVFSYGPLTTTTLHYSFKLPVTGSYLYMLDAEQSRHVTK